MYLDEIKDVIQAKGISTKDIAWRLGVSPSTVYKKLSGRSEMTVSELLNICDALRISPKLLDFE